MRILWPVLDSYEDTCNSTLDHRSKVHEKDFPIHLVLSFLQRKFFLPKSVFFAFCFLPDAFYIDVETKLMMPEAVNDICMPSFCFHERIFSTKFGDNISLVGMSWRYKFIGRYMEILPWKCRYRLGIKVVTVLISISKKVSPGGTQALVYLQH